MGIKGNKWEWNNQIRNSNFKNAMASGKGLSLYLIIQLKPQNVEKNSILLGELLTYSEEKLLLLLLVSG